ncbi:hypothetical protein [Streptomyces sp. NPDC002676]
MIVHSMVVACEVELHVHHSFHGPHRARGHRDQRVTTPSCRPSITAGR